MARSNTRIRGLRITPVPSDGHGVRTDLLREAFRTSGAKVFYCQPAYANPSGAVLSTERRTTVLETVAAAGAFLVEDDWARVETRELQVGYGA